MVYVAKRGRVEELAQHFPFYILACVLVTSFVLCDITIENSPPHSSADKKVRIFVFRTFLIISVDNFL
eukprot:UN22682